MSRVFEASERARKTGSSIAGVEPFEDHVPAKLEDAPLVFPREAPAETLSVAAAAPVTVARPPRERDRQPEPERKLVARHPAAPLVETLGQKLITAGESPAAFTEYRRMAATLFQSQVEHHVRTVMVTSAMPAEGKSLTAANLALTLANAYRRSVLLIDGDTRRPTLDQLFSGKNSIGFLECIRHGRLLPSAATEVAEGLHLLAGGMPGSDPVSELSSPRVREFFADAARTYDWIVVDTPPAVLLPDAELLAPVVDACVLVIEAGRTPFKRVQRVIETIGRDRFLGVVLNRADPGQVQAADYGDYYQSRYGSGTAAS
jgi:capsular exopolysaccharide synthesis family protein